jgi:hypothetical protein
MQDGAKHRWLNRQEAELPGIASMDQKWMAGSAEPIRFE